jgi:hypothetical protein
MVAIYYQMVWIIHYEVGMFVPMYQVHHVYTHNSLALRYEVHMPYHHASIHACVLTCHIVRTYNSMMRVIIYYDVVGRVMVQRSVVVQPIG